MAEDDNKQSNTGVADAPAGDELDPSQREVDEALRGVERATSAEEKKASAENASRVFEPLGGTPLPVIYNKPLGGGANIFGVTVNHKPMLPGAIAKVAVDTEIEIGGVFLSLFNKWEIQRRSGGAPLPLPKPIFSAKGALIYVNRPLAQLLPVGTDFEIILFSEKLGGRRRKLPIRFVFLKPEEAKGQKAAGGEEAGRERGGASGPDRSAVDSAAGAINTLMGGVQAAMGDPLAKFAEGLKGGKKAAGENLKPVIPPAIKTVPAARAGNKAKTKEDFDADGGDADVTDEISTQTQVRAAPETIRQSAELVGEYIDKNPETIEHTQTREKVLGALKSGDLSGLSAEEHASLQSTVKTIASSSGGAEIAQLKSAARMVGSESASIQAEMQNEASAEVQAKTGGGLAPASAPVDKRMEFKQSAELVGEYLYKNSQLVPDTAARGRILEALGKGSLESLSESDKKLLVNVVKPAATAPSQPAKLQAAMQTVADVAEGKAKLPSGLAQSPRPVGPLEAQTARKEKEPVESEESKKQEQRISKAEVPEQRPQQLTEAASSAEMAEKLKVMKGLEGQLSKVPSPQAQKSSVDGVQGRLPATGEAVSSLRASEFASGATQQSSESERKLESEQKLEESGVGLPPTDLEEGAVPEGPQEGLGGQPQAPGAPRPGRGEPIAPAPPVGPALQKQAEEEAEKKKPEEKPGEEAQAPEEEIPEETQRAEEARQIAQDPRGLKSFNQKEAEVLLNKEVNAVLNKVAIGVWATAIETVFLTVLLGAIIGDIIWIFGPKVIASSSKLASWAAKKFPKMPKGFREKVDISSVKLKLSLGVKAHIAAMNAVVLLIAGLIFLLVAALWGVCNRIEGYPLKLLYNLEGVCVVLDKVSTSLNDAASYANNLTTQPPPVPSGGLCAPVAVGPASPQALASTCFGQNAPAASIIANPESGGDPTRESGADKCKDGNSFSIGLFQINLVAHGDKISPACGKSSLFKINGQGFQGDCLSRNSKGICVRYDCEVINLPQYNICKDYLKDASQNINLACRISNNGQNWSAWSNTARACGF